ncbi:P2Y purinoceptor 13-like [Salarias fasciatus]|uniref:P2Y purinoceptor 13-like n=1 Tax=Salarias fasciatus TaxID=181472 RepID=A0A672G2I4_SALFA|nr:P2Y purinoceptor 13-like [Salarias fasciatus]
MSHQPSHTSPSCASASLEPADLALSIFFFCLFPIALLLNAVAAWVSWHLRSTSTFVVYLKNLVAADLLMTLTLPLMAASLLPGVAVDLRVFACRYSDVVFFTSLYTSIALMGLISLDRFFKVVRPFGRVMGQSVMFSVIMSTLVWVGLFGSTTIPTMILTDHDPANTSDQFCMSLKSASGRHFHMIVVLSMDSLFWLVCILVVFCYICITLKVLQSFRNSGSSNSQGKKKTTLRVFLIILVFLVCFLPLHLIRIPYTLKEIFFSGICLGPWLKIAHKLSLWISTTNACMDPVLYIYLCKEYRDKLVHLLKSRGVYIRQGSSDCSSSASVVAPSRSAKN